MSTFESRFELGDKVTLNGDTSLIAVVTGVLWKSSYCQIEISWIHSGDIKSTYVDEWRLTPAEAS